MHVSTLLLQIGLILVAARLTGLIFRKLHQPQVVGEMAAGILLGPSFLGSVAPHVSAAVFPPESLSHLGALSQIGLILFMFLVGLELKPQLLREKGEAAVLTSHVSIVIPMFLGILLSIYLYPRLSDDSVSFLHFALFMGTAMSITAFPVLARILTERKLLKTEIGSVSIASAAVDDVTAWCVLAGVVLMVRSGEGGLPLWVTIAGSLAYVCLMVFGVRHLLKKLADAHRRQGRTNGGLLAVILLLILGSAWVTEKLGIHALFGAFLVGAIMPKEESFVNSLTGKMQDVVVVLLLPLFFALTGLKTNIGSIAGAEMWFYCFLVTGVAIVGKLGGATIAAHITGLSWRQAGAIGVLMNTRGLIQLVVLNIGLEIGVISPDLFTMMVIMALVTTFMTTPLLDWLYPQSTRKPAAELVA